MGPDNLCQGLTPWNGQLDLVSFFGFGELTIVMLNMLKETYKKKFAFFIISHSQQSDGEGSWNPSFILEGKDPFVLHIQCHGFWYSSNTRRHRNTGTILQVSLNANMLGISNEFSRKKWQNHWMVNSFGIETRIFQENRGLFHYHFANSPK